MRFFEELKRRHVVRVAAAYLALAWLLVQIVETLFPMFGFFACMNDKDDGAFGSGGSSADIGNTESDTGADGGDSGVSDGVSPTITSLSASFEKYPNIGMVLEVSAAYTDPQDDVDGGTVTMSYSEKDGEAEEMELSIDGSESWIDTDEGTVVFALSGIDTGTTYVVTVQLTDSSGNSSTTEEATVQGS